MPEDQEARIPQNQPKIEVADDIRSERCPYFFDVDPNGVTQLLQATGISDQDLPKVSIRFSRKPKPEDGELGISKPLGMYKQSTQTIEMYTDELWRNSEITRKANRLISQRRALSTPLDQKKVKNEFKGLTSGQRFSWYLTFAPKERALAMAEKLEMIASARKMEGALGHEAMHAADVFKGDLKESRIDKAKGYIATLIGTAGIAGLGSLASGLTQGHIDLNTSLAIATLTAAATTPFVGKYVYYGFFNGPENKAKKFEKELAQKPRQRFITFTPK